MHKFKAGQKVRIKTWAEMEEEFGLNVVGSVKVEYSFTPEMERRMPEDRVVTVDNRVITVAGRCGTAMLEGRLWNISKDMVAEWDVGGEEVHKFKAGLKVRIKTWAEVEEEFGLDGAGSIAVRCSFSRDMERRMPEDRVVTVADRVGHCGRVMLEGRLYFLCEGMIAEWDVGWEEKESLDTQQSNAQKMLGRLIKCLVAEWDVGWEEKEPVVSELVAHWEAKLATLSTELLETICPRQPLDLTKVREYNFLLEMVSGRIAEESN